MKEQSAFSNPLLLLFIVAIISVIIIELIPTQKEPHPLSHKFNLASNLASEWFNIINIEKKKRQLISREWAALTYGGLMGVEYTYLTTTLGSVEAKQTSVNPEFAALLLKWMYDSGFDSTSIVGVNISGSFPALAISTLAAIKILGAKAILISSVGASSFGANDSLATWIDMERWLRSANCGFDFKSVLITPGGINDNGGGLQPEGIQQIKSSVDRNKVEISVPKNLKEASQWRTNIFSEANVNVIVNVGGNHPALGACKHSWQLQNEVITENDICFDDDRSFLFGFVEKGIPVFHLLNIKPLAIKYGFPLSPVKSINKSEKIYFVNNSSHQKIVAIILILITSVIVFVIRKKQVKIHLK